MDAIDPRDPCPVPLARVMRGGLVESLHRGHLALVTPEGGVLRSLGDPDFPTFLRSAAKPFQALAVVESGAAQKFAFTQAETAIMCGSVSGQDYHVATVLSILDKIGLDESALKCGAHPPSHGPTKKAMDARGEKPRAIHNNCAGKHAAMLALCVYNNWPVEDYPAANHPVQRLIKSTVADFCGLAPEELGVGIDGCGVPVFRAPLSSMALGYARLASPERGGFEPNRVQAVKTLMGAALAHPEMIAGDQRVCTEAMRQAPGRFLAKTGAEASYGVSLIDEGWGLAFKIEDGSQRALAPVLIEALRGLGKLGRKELTALAEYRQPEIKNHLKDVVGRIEPAFSLESGLG